MLALTKAYALSAASDEARAIRDDIAFYQTIRAAPHKVRHHRVSGGARFRGAAADRSIGRVDRDCRHPARRGDDHPPTFQSCPTTSSPRSRRWTARTWRWRHSASCSATRSDRGASPTP
ncbi:DUF3387 domain-containing protein [Sphingomonas sp. H160509]|uniref:DUF3387 domain-containing protein n=1 Tax=Sphingomonas sp. H160509 TaxID=2955313 RepID=UPI0021E8D81A|nr:DUF3387 domain-containing protein [Sphingomonas sp. H160509]